jgi:hypothetical protein
MKSISTAVVKLEGVTPYSPSRNYTAEVPKLKDESPEAYDDRTWRNHAHIDKKTKNIIIPGECFAWAIKAMSKRRSDRDIDTKCHVDKAAMESFMAHVNGVRGSGARVLRRFPIVPNWSGEITFMMWDVRIPEAVFRETLEDAGLLIGVGRRRPENKGFFGRFQVQSIGWNERVDAAKILGI